MYDDGISPDNRYRERTDEEDIGYWNTASIARDLNAVLQLTRTVKDGVRVLKIRKAPGSVTGKGVEAWRAAYEHSAVIKELWNRRILEGANPQIVISVPAGELRLNSHLSEYVVRNPSGMIHKGWIISVY